MLMTRKERIFDYSVKRMSKQVSKYEMERCLSARIFIIILSKIFEKAGVPVQETILGTYKTKKGVEKIVVACKDFTSAGIELQDFASLIYYTPHCLTQK